VTDDGKVIEEGCIERESSIDDFPTDLFSGILGDKI
jgi:hypothetical protein